jgi:Alanine racemase, N-terminal domain
MTFTLYVDGPRWHAHTEAVLAQTPGLVPVIKGYGFGCGLLAVEAARLGAAVVAVGQAEEVASIRGGSGTRTDVLVLTPYLPEVDEPAAPDDQVIRTVATTAGLDASAGHRVVVELLSPVQRFGFADRDLAEVRERLGPVRLEGFALHLPMARGDLPRVAEVEAWLTRLQQAQLAAGTLWVSHLSDSELAELTARHPDITFRARVGTRLWLGDRGAAQARGTVLATHRLRRGERYGYRQRRAPRAGTLVVVGGGTSHGVALAAPTPAAGLGQRARTVASSGLEAVGRALSPFRVDGARRWFAEPPHMQVSMLWLPDGVGVPAVGSELDVDVRMTTSTFDRVVVSD